MGLWFTATVAGESVPIGLAVKGVRSRVETEFEPVFAITARFVSGLMATPLGAVPTAMSVTPVTGAKLARSRIVTVFAELLVTTATPDAPAAWPVIASLGRTATPVGVPPV